MYYKGLKLSLLLFYEIFRLKALKEIEGHDCITEYPGVEPTAIRIYFDMLITDAQNDYFTRYKKSESNELPEELKAELPGIAEQIVKYRREKTPRPKPAMVVYTTTQPPRDLHPPAAAPG